MKNEKYLKVTDRCHNTGEYRGAAYGTCNLKHSVLKKIPIVVDNGSNYDNHFYHKRVSRSI